MMNKLCGWISVAALAVGCGGSATNQTVPTLPGDGDANTEKPLAPHEGGPGGPWADSSKLLEPPAPGPARPLELPESIERSLANGLGVILVPDPAAPVISVQLAIRAGREGVARDKVGLARMTAATLARGARGRNAAAIERATEAAGVSLSADASYEATLISCNGPASATALCIDLVADMAISPTFPAAEVAKVANEIRVAVRQLPADGGKLAGTHLQNLLWGADHPRGWPLSPRTIGAIDRGDLVSWHQRTYRPNNAILAITGDFDPTALEARVKRSFGRWVKRAVPKREAAKAPALSGISIRLVDKPDHPGADIRIGRPGVGHGDPTFHAAAVANHILGGGEGSRLRRKLGSAAVVSQLDRNLEAGALVVSAAVEAEDVVKSIRSITDAMSELATKGPTAAEIEAAGLELAGSYAVQLQSPTDVAGALLAAKLHGQGRARVEGYPVAVRKLDAAAVRAAARRLMQSDDLAIAVVGPATAIRSQLDQAGWKYDVVGFTDPVAPWEREIAESEAITVLDQAVGAKGGAKALVGLKTFVWSGSAELRQPNGSTTAKVEKRFVAPDRLRLDMKLKDPAGNEVKLVTVMTGTAGWAQQIAGGQSQSVAFPDAEVEAGRAQIWRDQDLVLLRHRDEGAKVAVQGELDIDGRACWAIQVTSPRNQYTALLYIDKRTKLLAGMSYRERGPDGRPLVTEERYSNYRGVSGIQVAHKRVTRSAQLDLTTTLESVKINGPVDNALFVKPKK
jgi:predicted Zn-dependent peptidase